LQLKNLKVFDLADNIIEVIPSEIDRLSQLETLSLWDNPITTYPESLTNMQRLKVFDLLNNAISRETQQRLKEGLPKCKVIMSPPCACMDGDN
jgi:Leucine-rich repeat (LRR) protein